MKCTKNSTIQPIDQIVILIVTEENATQTFIKNKKDYLPLLKPAIESFIESLKMKNKILDNLPAIFVALVFLFSMILTFNHAKAEDKRSEYNLQFMSYPMMCGFTRDVDRYIKDNEFTIVNVSFNKENAKEDGNNIVFAIKYYINDKHQTLAEQRHQLIHTSV